MTGCFLALACPALGQVSVGLTFRVQAHHPDGRPVLDLQPYEVVIAQDGVGCPVVDMERVGWPLKVVLLLDDSTWMQGYLVHLRNSLGNFVDALPTGAEIAVVAMSNRPDELEFITDREEVGQRLGQYLVKNYVRASSARALHEVLEALYLTDAEGPVIAVVAGDAPAPIGRDELDETIERILNLGATVDTLALRPPRVRPADGLALRFSEMTNGWSRRLGRPSPAVGDLLGEMGAAIARRAGDGANHYLVTCEPQSNTLDAESFGAGVLREGVDVRVNGQVIPVVGQ